MAASVTPAERQRRYRQRRRLGLTLVTLTITIDHTADLLVEAGLLETIVAALERALHWASPFGA